jgi:hypothetical protein
MVRCATGPGYILAGRIAAPDSREVSAGEVTLPACDQWVVKSPNHSAFAGGHSGQQAGKNPTGNGETSARGRRPARAVAAFSSCGSPSPPGHSQKRGSTARQRRNKSVGRAALGPGQTLFGPAPAWDVALTLRSARADLKVGATFLAAPPRGADGATGILPVLGHGQDLSRWF